MLKDRRPTGHKEADRITSEDALDRRDKTIRKLIDDLVSGTQELKSLYGGDNNARPEPS